MSKEFAQRLVAMSPVELLQQHFEATTRKLSGDALEADRHRMLTEEILRRLVKFEAAQVIFAV